MSDAAWGGIAIPIILVVVISFIGILALLGGLGGGRGL